MRRIDAITRCKDVLAEVLNRKSARILRIIDEHIDSAKASAHEYQDQAEDLMYSLGSYASTEQAGNLDDKLSEYSGLIEKAEDRKREAERFIALKEKLLEEVQEEGSK